MKIIQVKNYAKEIKFLNRQQYSMKDTPEVENAMIAWAKGLDADKLYKFERNPNGFVWLIEVKDERRISNTE